MRGRCGNCTKSTAVLGAKFPCRIDILTSITKLQLCPHRAKQNPNNAVNSFKTHWSRTTPKSVDDMLHPTPSPGNPKQVYLNEWIPIYQPPPRVPHLIGWAKPHPFQLHRNSRFHPQPALFVLLQALQQTPLFSRLCTAGPDCNPVILGTG